jgi:hypothetical protein
MAESQLNLSGDGPAPLFPLPCPSDGERLAILLRNVRRTEKVSGGFEEGVGDALAALQAALGVLRDVALYGREKARLGGGDR